MKTIILGDTHIGNVQNLGRPNGSGGNTRVDDYEKSLNFVIDYSISIKADIFINTGDLFEVRSPTTEHMQIADRCIKRLSDANIFTVIIMGNHDYRKTGDTFTSALATMQANSYKNVRILLSPEIISYANKRGEAQSMLLIPYRDKKMYLGQNTKESTDLFNSHIKEMASKINRENPSIAVGHNFFFDGNYFDYGGHEVLASPDSFLGLDAVVMGHYHEFKHIRKSGPEAYYVGSMEKTNFGDADITKYFLVFDSETKSFEKVKIPTRDIIDLNFDLSESTGLSYLDDYKNQVDSFDLKDKICRAKIKIKEGMQSLFSKSDIEKILYSSGVFHISKIIWDVEQFRIDKNKEILSHKTDFEIFEAFAKTQGLEESLLQRIIEESKKVIG
jgi:DNA repair exonuclease SbcCD nuclease subunit